MHRLPFQNHQCITLMALAICLFCGCSGESAEKPPPLPRNKTFTSQTDAKDSNQKTNKPLNKSEDVKWKTNCGARLVQLEPSPKRPAVMIVTRLGVFYIELFSEKAPAHVSAFLERVKANDYDGTIFHRVVPGFLIQGGGYDSNLRKRSTKTRLPSEARNGIMNLRGTVSMSRLDNDPHSADREWFINLSDNLQLDHKGPVPLEYGYTVFGQVISGMEVVDKMSRVPIQRKDPFPDGVPKEPVIIKQIKRVR